MSENVFVGILRSCSDYCFEEGGSLWEHLLRVEGRFDLYRSHDVAGMELIKK